MDASPDEGRDSVCADCGVAIDVALERGYSFSEEQALCFSCAVARGGAYDELHDHWTKPPNLRGLSAAPGELGAPLP
jgi:hypothetical protein